jgi:hypothetical protein
VDDLERLIQSKFYNREHLRRAYLEIAELLSKNIQGKQDTLLLATLLGHEPPSTWGKPIVDLNLALRASLSVSKSVLSPKSCPDLEIHLNQILAEYRALLEKTEIAFADKLVNLVKKRDKLRKKRKSSGIINRIVNFFLDIAIGIRNLQAKISISNYGQQKHLKRIAREYEKATQKICAPHVGWYNFKIPKIDISIVEKELLSMQEAAAYFGLGENAVRDLVKKEKIQCYNIKNKELIKKSELMEVSTQASLKDTS